jgi:hypothetical protein
MRCLFQIAQPTSQVIALQLLDQVHSTARDAAQVSPQACVLGKISR